MHPLPTDFQLPGYIIVTPYAVEFIISYQLGKAAVSDAINNRILKEFKNVISAPLCDLFNASLSQEKVPYT